MMRLRRPKDDRTSAEQSPKRASKRLQPTESLHMKTRAASKNASVATSADGSEAGNNSRRSSRGDNAVNIGGSDSDSNRPAKRSRISYDAETEAPGFLNDTADSNMQETIVVGGSSSHVANGNVTPEPSENDRSDAYDSPNDAASNIGDLQQDVAQDSIEFPLLSEFRKPFRGTRRRLKKRKPPNPPFKVSKTSASQTPGYGTPTRVEGVSSTKNESPEKRDASKMTKRLPGRRRAPNPDANIEADLRRQLELKVAYRAVTKALKPLLAELAKRTAQELEEDPELHVQHTEYEKITAVLDLRLKERLEWLEQQRAHEQARIQRMIVAEKEAAKIRLTGQVRDLQADHLLRCKQKILSHIRKLEREDDSDATEDEDDVVPRLRRVAFPQCERILVDERCDSRSRFFVQAEKYWDRFLQWDGFRKQQQAHDPASIIRLPKNFATFDSDKRQIATTIMNVHQLANAAQEVEDHATKAAQAAISNQEATGLQALATASDMAIKAPPLSAGIAKAARKPLPPLSVSFAPIYTAPGPTNNNQPAVTPSKKRSSNRSRAPSNYPNGPGIPPAPPHIPNDPNIPMGPRPMYPPYNGPPISYGPNETGGYGPFREPYPPMRHAGGMDPIMPGGNPHEQSGNAPKTPNPPHRAPENGSTPSRSQRPDSSSMHTFPLLPRGPPPPTILPPYAGPFGHPMPPPNFRHAPIQPPPTASSPPQASPVSSFAVGYSPRQTPQNSVPRRESSDGGHRRSGSDWKMYGEPPTRKSNTPSSESHNPGSAQAIERPPYHPQEPPVQSTPGRDSGDGNRDGHPLPPPPPQVYPSPFPPQSFPPPPPLGHSPYYPPSNYYGPPPPRFGPLTGSNPPTQGSPNSFFAGNYRPSLPQYQQSPAFPPISPHGPVHPPYGPPGPHSRQTSIPLQQIPGQVGHQTILPATLDPRRHQSTASPPQPFPHFSQLSAIPRPYGEHAPERPRQQQNPVNFQFESYKGPPKR